MPQLYQICSLVAVLAAGIVATQQRLVVEQVEKVCANASLRQFRLPFAPGIEPVSTICEVVLQQFSPAQASCRADGGKTSCSFEQVEAANRQLSKLLARATATSYFRYFKVNLFCDCPLWPEDGMCAMEACSVCECDNEEVPPAWRDEEEDCQALLGKVEEEAAVDRTLATDAAERLLALPGWKGLDNPWLPELDTDVEFSYINLLVNAERYTGYSGEHAHRIWSAIYSQNCFKDVHTEACDEESLVFYRIISGVHSSISMHLTNEYLLDESAQRWGPNMTEFRSRFAPATKHACDHVKNLYFAYLFVLRAVAKAAPAMRAVHYHTGLPEEDQETQALMADVLASEALDKACSLPFDEGRLWKGQDSAALRGQLQVHFHNITSIMDCVGCEKCKLWGKLQFLGVATSLKILFASNNCFERNLQPAELLRELKLERNEVIALVNLLAKLSHSVAAYRDLSRALEHSTGIAPCFRVEDVLL